MTKMIGTIGLTRMNNWMRKMSGMDRSHLMKEPENIILFKGESVGFGNSNSGKILDEMW